MQEQPNCGMSADERIGEHIRKSIERTPYTQAMVAGELGIDANTLSRYIRGKSKAPEKTISDIARICKDKYLKVRCGFENELLYESGICPQYDDRGKSLADFADIFSNPQGSLSALVQYAGGSCSDSVRSYVEELARKVVISGLEVLSINKDTAK